MDLFDMLNPTWSSILPYCPWLWSYNQNRLRFRCFLKSSDEEPQTTIRTSSKNENRPIWCAESNGTIHFPVSLLVPKAEAKTSPIWRFFNLLTQGLQPRVGRCSMAAFKLILRGESNTGIHFPLRWLVIEESPVMSPILPIMPLFEPLTKSPQLPLDHLSGA